MRVPGISMIVLGYEDAPSLPPLVSELDVVLRALGKPYEILIVDDGSQDATPCAVAELVLRYGVVSVRHEVNRGVGAAFATGVRTARYDTIGYIDGDGQFAPADLQPLAALLQSADAAFGVRVERADPPRRRIISGIYNVVVGRLFGLQEPDVNCGLKLFRSRFLDLCPMESTGSFFDVELLVKGRAAGMVIAHAPVRHLPRRHGIERGASLSSVLSAIESMTDVPMQRFRRPGAEAWILGSVMGLLCSALRRVQR